MSGPIFDHEPHAPSLPRDPARVELYTTMAKLIIHRQKSPIPLWIFPERRRQHDAIDVGLEAAFLVTQAACGIIPYPRTLEDARDQGLITPSHWAYKADFAT